MHNTVFSSIFLLVIILFQPVTVEHSSVIETSEVVILFEEPLRTAAREVADIYAGVKVELEETLGWRLNFRPTVLLIKDRETFQKIIGSKLVVAVAIPRKKLVVIDYSRMREHPFTVGTTLKHELCHLLLHHHIRRSNLPKWLDEGISQWVSDGMAEIITDGRRSFLNEAILSGNYLSLDELTASFPKDKKSLLLAYEESKSIVEYINSRFGRDGILNILMYLKEGYDVDAAVLKSLSIPLYELERRWHGHLRRRTTWITYMAANLYEILFFVAALITVYGFIKFLIKKRNYRD